MRPVLTVDAARAFADLQTLAAMGPRPSGSPGMARQMTFLTQRARDLGYQPEVDAFVDETPTGPIEFQNLIVRLKGRHPGFIILGAHHDTKRIPGVPDFVGANDGASGTALLLELMRVLKTVEPWPGPELRFVFFDGEEAQVAYGPRDGFHGSRRLATAWERSGELKRCHAMILVDMVADRDLKLTLSTGDDPKLLRLALDIARAQGIGERVGFHRHGVILDDHTAFLERGVPAINLIDFDYGPNNSFWHTNQDTVAHCHPDSLGLVGNLALALLARLPLAP